MIKYIAGCFFAVVLIMGLGSSAEAGTADPSQGYRQVNLVSDVSGLARNTDSNLVNPWGVVVQPFDHIRVSGNGTGVSPVYRPNGKQQTPVINIPGPGGVGKGTPTGIVYNDTRDFIITGELTVAPSTFIFATEDGSILGWNPDVDADTAIIAVDNSALNPDPGAVYKGIAIGQINGENFIYVTNFRAGIVEVYNASFEQVNEMPFTDEEIPAGFAPFGIRNIDGELYVTYAKQDADKLDDVPGAGNGFVNVFDTSGNLVKRFASRGELNSPWGLVLAPERFGAFSKAILVGNSGDGHINAFDSLTGEFLGQMQDLKRKTVVIEGLRGFDFGKISVDENAAGVDPRPVLFFTAGIENGSHGLFGYIRPYSPVSDLLYADFGVNGIHSYDGENWVHLPGADPETMVSFGTSMYASYGVWGLWKWDGAQWTQLSAANAESIVVSGDYLYANYGVWGLWRWDGTQWTQLSPARVESMTASGEYLYTSFGVWGVWRWNGTQWTQLTSANANSLVASGEALYSNFGIWGLWKWNGAQWTQLSADNPGSMAASGEDLYSSFGTLGLWRWNGAQWTRVNSMGPEKMAVSGSTVYLDYGAWGLWEWDRASTWTHLTPDNPATIANAN